MQWAAFLAGLATLALAVSCTGFFPPEQLSSISIVPSSPTVPLGSTLQLAAFGTNTDGSSAGNITGKVSWSSSSGAISVSSAGVLTGNDLSATAATITAQSLSQAVSATASATVCVEGGTNFTINFNPSNSIVQNATLTLTATATVSGITGPVDVTSGVQWSSSSSGVSITNGSDPVSVDTSGVTTVPVTVTIFGAYTCNGVTNNFQANLTVT